MKLAKNKKLKITVGINSLVSTKHIAYSNHLQFWYRLGRNYKHDFILVNPSRMGIDRFRNMASQVAMDTESDYLLFLDDDVLIPFDCLTKLIEADADIVSADVIIRGYPFNHMLFKYTDKSKTGLKPMSRLPDPRGVINVDAVGCSLTMIKTSLLKKVPLPHFVTGPETNTEDIYFCMKARTIDPKCTIKADTSIICQHILWEESIGSNNLQQYRKYHESLYGKPTKAKDEAEWRGKNYLKMAKEVTGEKTS